MIDSKLEPNPSLKELIGYDPYQIAMRTPADLTLILRGRRAGDGDWSRREVEMHNPFVFADNFLAKIGRVFFAWKTAAQ